MKINPSNKELDSNSVSTTFYEKLTPDGLHSIMKNRARSSELELIKKLCNKKDKILDLACGYGRITIPVYKLGYNIEGVDNSKVLIRKAKQNALESNLGVFFKLGSMIELPFSNDSYNKIFCFWTSLAHILNRYEQIDVFNEVYRVLAPDGIAFFDTVDAETKTMRKVLNKEGFGHNKRLWKSKIKGIESILYYHDRKSLLNLCVKSKFKKYKVGFKNMDGKRRIVAYLYKI